MNKKMIILKIILSLLLVLGLQLLEWFGYSVGCLVWPLWDFSYVFDISIMFLWFFPIIIYENMNIRTLILLAILNLIVSIWIFYGVPLFFSEIFL